MPRFLIFAIIVSCHDDPLCYFPVFVSTSLHFLFVSFSSFLRTIFHHTSFPPHFSTAYLSFSLIFFFPCLILLVSFYPLLIVAPLAQGNESDEADDEIFANHERSSTISTDTDTEIIPEPQLPDKPSILQGTYVPMTYYTFLTIVCLHKFFVILHKF